MWGEKTKREGAGGGGGGGKEGHATAAQALRPSQGISRTEDKKKEEKKEALYTTCWMLAPTTGSSRTKLQKSEFGGGRGHSKGEASRGSAPDSHAEVERLRALRACWPWTARGREGHRLRSGGLVSTLVQVTTGKHWDGR